MSLQLISDPRGPFFGELAQGLAVGAQNPVIVWQPWNRLTVMTGDWCAESLREAWQVVDAPGLRRAITSLLEGRNTGGDTGMVMHVRRRLADTDPEAVGSVTAWREATRSFANEEDLTEHAEFLADLATRAFHIEARLREAGVVPDDEVVKSSWGYDFGRAVMLARFGFTAGLLDEHETITIVLRAFELASRTYGSWSEYSASFVFGRLFRFDATSFGYDGDPSWDVSKEPWFRQSVEVHQLLMSHPHSPWRNLPFEMEEKTG